MKNLKQAGFLFGVVAPLLLSCAPESNQTDTPALSIQPPALLLTSRMVDQDQLFVTVEVGGEAVDMSASEDGSWRGTIELTPDTQHEFTVSWFENYTFNNEQRDLLLAQAIKRSQVSAGDTSAQITIRTDEFNFSFDEDFDGRSNLSERNNGTEPFDPLSPAAGPSEVSVAIQISIPDDLQAADNISDALYMAIRVNNQSRDDAFTRASGQWLGAEVVNENSEVFIRAELFSDMSRSLRLGDVSKSVNVGSGDPVVIAAGEFDFTFDDDGDSISNREELINGSNPLDSNSPVPDPCLPTAFAPGCTTDTDGDGETDFEETELADSDGDGIPDYRESNIVDLDDDSTFAHLDPDENDPCIPSMQALACLAVANGATNK